MEKLQAIVQVKIQVRKNNGWTKVNTTIMDEIQGKQLIYHAYLERMGTKSKEEVGETVWIDKIQRVVSKLNLIPGDWHDRGGCKLGIRKSELNIQKTNEKVRTKMVTTETDKIVTRKCEK